MFTKQEKAIGIFDSGIGGLTVLKELKKIIPGEKLIYLGDTARVPYGIRSSQTVIKYSIANADFLIEQNIKMLIIACNTASAVAIDALRQKYSIPIVDVVQPGARGAVSVTRNNRIGIIGTLGTIKSGAYQKEIKRLMPEAETYTQPCPLFVPLAEEGWCDSDDEVVIMVAKRYLERLKSFDIDTLVLGCTHYPLLKGALKRVMGEGIVLIDSAEQTALSVKSLLVEKQLLGNAGPKCRNLFYLTDIPHRFKKTGKRFLGEVLEDVKVIDI